MYFDDNSYFIADDQNSTDEFEYIYNGDLEYAKGDMFYVAPPFGLMRIDEVYLLNTIGEKALEKVMLGEELSAECHISNYSQTAYIGSETLWYGDIEIVSFDESIEIDDTSNNVPSQISGKNVKTYVIEDGKIEIALEGTFSNLKGMLIYDDYFESYSVVISDSDYDSHQMDVAGETILITPPIGMYSVSDQEVMDLIGVAKANEIKESSLQVDITCDISNFAYSAKVGSSFSTNADVHITDVDLPEPQTPEPQAPAPQTPEPQEPVQPIIDDYTEGYELSKEDGKIQITYNNTGNKFNTNIATLAYFNSQDYLERFVYIKQHAYIYVYNLASKSETKIAELHREGMDGVELINRHGGYDEKSYKRITYINTYVDSMWT